MAGRGQWLLGCVLGLGVQGCALLGAGIGAGVDSMIPGPYEERAPDQVLVERGDRVVLVTRTGRRLEGRYLGALPPSRNDLESYVFLERDEGLTRVALSDLRSVGVEVAGKGWLYGGIVGLAVDVAVWVGLIIAVNNWEMNFEQSESNCFC